MNIFFFCCLLASVNADLDKNENDVALPTANNYAELYSMAKEAYLANDWNECLRLTNQALDDYHFYHQTVTTCKRGCKKEAQMAMEKPTENEPTITRHDVDDLLFFEKATRNTLCLMRCKLAAFGKNRVEYVEKKVEEDFESKELYNYLQLCYHQIGDFPSAASAAFTHLVYNPNNKITKENLELYTKKPGVVKEFVLNYEAESFVAPFLTGTEHYRNEEWSDVVGSMEEAVDKYLGAEERCRFKCEKPFDMGWYPDFITSVANHFTFCLRCKQRCVLDLQNVNGEQIGDVYPLLYNYLQFSYYQLGEIEKAGKCVSSFLLFYPEDSKMLKNKEFYLSMDGFLPEWMESTRTEASVYFERDEYERQLLDFIDGRANKEEDAEDDDTKDGGEIRRIHDAQRGETGDSGSLNLGEKPTPPPSVSKLDLA